MVCPFWECCWYFDQASLIWLFHFIHILLHMFASYFLCRNLKGTEVSLSLILLIPLLVKMKSLLFNMGYGLSQSGPEVMNHSHPLSPTSMHTVFLPHGIFLRCLNMLFLVWNVTLLHPHLLGELLFQQFSHFSAHQNHLEYLLYHRLLDSTSGVSDLIGQRPLKLHF